VIRICMVCDKVFGEKEPLDDNSPTHGICDPCFEEIRATYENPKSSGTKRPEFATYANYHS